MILPLVAGIGCSASFQLKPPLARSGDAGIDSPAWMVDDEMARPAAGAANALLATSAPPATRPGDHLNLVEAPPLDSLLRSSAARQVELVRRLQPTAAAAIYFGHLLSPDPGRRSTRATPIIATRSANRWKAIHITDDHGVDAAWAYVGAGPQRGHALAVLEPPPRQDGKPAHLLLVHTTDLGATWRTIRLLKPSASARYDSICMSPHRGRITVYQPPGERSARPGFYHYYTSDDGATWSSPTFEPDALSPADPLSDSEQIRLRTDSPSRAVNAGFNPRP